MRFKKTIEVCDICGKRFYGMPINIHGSYEYIHHTNFSNNIGVIFARTVNVPRDMRANAIVKQFFEISKDGNKAANKEDLIEYLECFKHFHFHDEKMLNEVFEEIQNKIDNMK